MSKAISLSAVVVMTLTSAGVQAQQRVIAGRSVGTITLGMRRGEVWKHIGKPTEIHFLHIAGRSYISDYWENESGREREFVISRRGRVVQITREVTDDERRVYLFPLLRRQHPHLKASLYIEYEDNGSSIVADDVRQGIAWSVYIHHYKDNEFDTHLLSEIGPDRITVHRKGAKALPNVGEILDEHDQYLGDIRDWFAARPHRKQQRS